MVRTKLTLLQLIVADGLINSGPVVGAAPPHIDQRAADLTVSSLTLRLAGFNGAAVAHRGHGHWVLRAPRRQNI